MKVSVAPHNLNEPDKYNTEWRDNSSRVRTHSGTLRQCCSPIGDNNTNIFCAQWGASIRLTVLKWSGEGRYPGAFALELSSRLFPRPDWLPLGLRSEDGIRTKNRTSRLTALHLPLWDVEEPTPLFGASQFHIFYWFTTMNWILPSSIVALSTSDISFLARSDERWPELNLETYQY